MVSGVRDLLFWLVFLEMSVLFVDLCLGIIRVFLNYYSRVWSFVISLGGLMMFSSFFIVSRP